MDSSSLAGPGTVLPGTDIELRSALTFTWEMLVPVQKSVLW